MIDSATEPEAPRFPRFEVRAVTTRNGRSRYEIRARRHGAAWIQTNRNFAYSAVASGNAKWSDR